MTATGIAYALAVLATLGVLWYRGVPFALDPGGYHDTIGTHDKLDHVMISAALAAIACVIGVPKGEALVVTILAGLGFECIQLLPRVRVDGKRGYFSVLDLFADVCGALIGVTIYALLTRR